MSEKITCGGCQSTHPSKDHIGSCYLCGKGLCPRCCRARTAKETGRTVRVCRDCAKPQTPLTKLV